LVRSRSAMRCHEVTPSRRADAGIEPDDGEPNAVQTGRWFIF
jgi:hypothetical protein